MAPGPGIHAHRCGACGHVWHHDERSLGSAEAHTCPSCRSGPYWNVHDAGTPWLAVAVVVGIYLLSRRS